jgi:hypothetical protein
LSDISHALPIFAFFAGGVAVRLSGGKRTLEMQPGFIQSITPLHDPNQHGGHLMRHPQKYAGQCIISYTSRALICKRRQDPDEK